MFIALDLTMDNSTISFKKEVILKTKTFIDILGIFEVFRYFAQFRTLQALEQ